MLANRAVWAVSLAAWAVVLAVGSYLDRVHLHVPGMVTLAVTSGLGLAYVLAVAERSRRWLGILANALLLAELGVHAAYAAPSGARGELLGFVLALVLLGIPLWLLAGGRASEELE